MEHTLAVATQISNRRTTNLAFSALPDAPTVPEPERPTRRAGRPAATLRHGVSVALRRLADRLDTQPGRTSLPGGAC